MKVFLGSLKGKILLACVGTLVVTAVVVGAIFLFGGEETYRSIAVENLQGVTIITDEDLEKKEAYKGMYLISGDDVQVQATSNVTLKLDADKHLYGSEGTHFKVECVDGEKSGKKVIHLMEGSILNRLESKLKDSESYEVETPNATMAVRGTVFRVTVNRDENGMIYTLVEVFDGQVQVDLKKENGDYNGVSDTFGAGESALIRGNTEFAEFVVGEENQYKNEIAYKELPQNVAKELVAYIDDGEELCIGKELLMDYTGLAEHKMETITGKEPTCTEEGYEEVWCVVCNEVTETVKIPMLGHKMADWEIAKAPTCVVPGNRQRICSVCKTYYEEEAIEALGHIKGEKEVTKEADCTNAGKEVVKCTRCGTNVEEHEIAALGHVSGGFTVTKAADCTNTGKEKAICTRCGAVAEERTIPASGHTPGSWTTVRTANCTTGGLSQITCTVCNAVVQTNTTAVLGHSYGSPVVVDATCTTEGSSTVTCATCGGTNTTVLAANGHDLDADTVEHSFIYDGRQQMVGVTCMQFCRIDTCDEVIATDTTFTLANDSYWCDNCGGEIPY